MGSQQSKAQPAPQAEVLNEKIAASQVYVTSDDEPEVESLTADVLDKWSTDFDKADPVLSLSSRPALVRDAKIFNLTLKGTDSKGEYPGPRVNQASSGRCWLFATKKYGIVPKTLYPEAFSSTSSGRLGSLLTSKLREYAILLRAESTRGGSPRKLKAKFLAEVFATLSIALGSPPKPDDKLTWEYYDKENKFHSWTGTPKDFYAQFGKRKGMNPSDSFSLINDPRNPYEKLYSVERLGNVWNGKPVRYAVIAGIKANTPLFFGCDVGKASSTPDGVMDTDLYDIAAAYGFKLGMNKAQRLETGESSVENSWSDSAGEKGWFMMTAAWFREYVFQVVVPKSIVDSKWSDLLNTEATTLKPWDPMVSVP
ncbi:hypothetical protein CI109_102707 [Kwoniella shandongensis]|uniref:Cysteine proteinase 1, mitochondrial n=1 Tax=Kwoniella shandongensis TaxID=1734106 RepID=A0AAJ8LI05_9TREE